MEVSTHIRLTPSRIGFNTGSDGEFVTFVPEEQLKASEVRIVELEAQVDAGDDLNLALRESARARIADLEADNRIARRLEGDARTARTAAVKQRDNAVEQRNNAWAALAEKQIEVDALRGIIEAEQVAHDTELVAARSVNETLLAALLSYEQDLQEARGEFNIPKPGESVIVRYGNHTRRYRLDSIEQSGAFLTLTLDDGSRPARCEWWEPWQ